MASLTLPEMIQSIVNTLWQVSHFLVVRNREDISVRSTVRTRGHSVYEKFMIKFDVWEP
jgi:hypothetical protein